MTHREEEAHPHRPAAPLHHQPGGVVDGRDVIGVERVPDAEGVGEHTGTSERAGTRRAAGHGDVERPPGDVQHHDDRDDAGQLQTLSAGPPRRGSRTDRGHS